MFDYIIVGGGSAGSVLANRLSSDSKRRVLLLEAGPDIRRASAPASIQSADPMAGLQPAYLWPQMKARQTAATAPRFYEQGRVIGGGSTVNAQVTNRGLPADYDEWAQLGANGWNWAAVLPYFRRLERDLDYTGPLHGNDGPIPIRRIPKAGWQPLAKAVAADLEDLGFTDIGDQNGTFIDGYFSSAISNIDGRREAVAFNYLDDAVRQRPNLEIKTNVLVDQVLLCDHVAVGVRLADGTELNGRQIVLSAGALQTPAIMMRSGLGPAEVLKRVGRNVVRDMPGVGRNLREHPGLTFSGYLHHAGGVARPRPDRPGELCFRFSSEAPGAPRSDMYMAVSVRSGWHAVGQRLALFFVWLNKPLSTGRVEIPSLDPQVMPEVDFNMLDVAADRDRLARGAVTAIRLMKGPRVGKLLTDPFPAVYDRRVRRTSARTWKNRLLMNVLGRALDINWLRPLLIRSLIASTRVDDLLAQPAVMQNYIMRAAAGVWHPAGTCKMGAADDALAVTDSSGRVKGIDRLSICDASVMPTLPAANTNIPTIMIAEKMSADWLGTAGI